MNAEDINSKTNINNEETCNPNPLALYLNGGYTDERVDDGSKSLLRALHDNADEVHAERFENPRRVLYGPSEDVQLHEAPGHADPLATHAGVDKPDLSWLGLAFLWGERSLVA